MVKARNLDIHRAMNKAQRAGQQRESHNSPASGVLLQYSQHRDLQAIVGLSLWGTVASSHVATKSHIAGGLKDPPRFPWPSREVGLIVQAVSSEHETADHIDDSFHGSKMNAGPSKSRWSIER